MTPRYLVRLVLIRRFEEKLIRIINSEYRVQIKTFLKALSARDFTRISPTVVQAKFFRKNLLGTARKPIPTAINFAINRVSPSLSSTDSVERNATRLSSFPDLRFFAKTA